jgi:hypothetical protein
MTRGELITALAEKGIHNLYGKSLSRCWKRELEDAHRTILEFKLPHLSFSEVNLFDKCAHQYYFRYIKGMKVAPGAPMVLGRAFDAAANHNYKQKMLSGDDEPLDVLTDVFHEDFNLGQKEVDWSVEEVKIEDVENKGVAAVSIFARDVSPVIMPVDVQRAIHIPGPVIGTGIPFVGFIDLIATDAFIDDSPQVIIDHKISGKKMTQEAVDIHDQLTCYAACESIAGDPIETVELDVLITKGKQESQQLRSKRTDADYQWWWQRVREYTPASATEYSREPVECTAVCPTGYARRNGVGTGMFAMRK